jgi:beta-lactamase regulating signal transducer with metallopeptidase domain
MVINPPLVFVGALFFLGLASILYLGSWLITTAILRFGRNFLPHAKAKQVLMVALVLPPLLAAVATWSGATLRHSHDQLRIEPHIEHHGTMCRQIFSEFLQAAAEGRSETRPGAAGTLIKVTAWLFLTVGLALVARLVAVTLRLERGLLPFLRQPSIRLTAALARVSKRRHVPVERFFECPIPAACSSVFGLRRIRCVLSQELVAAATEDELDAIVAHEAVHLTTGDVMATFMADAVSCMFFYLHPVRLLSRRWHEEAELACDAAAAASTNKPLAVAAAILRASGIPTESLTKGSSPVVALAFVNEAACLTSKRVESLLAQARQAALPRGNESRTRNVVGRAAMLVLAGVACVVLLSPQAACYVHCTLEAIVGFLP